jgi:hypothetical protein
MNQFILSRDPKQSAAWLCNSHSVKQPLEQAQMLSSCHRLLETPQADFVYKVAHANHPCTKWLRSSQIAYKYGLEYLEAMFAEYTHRYGKIHKTEREILPYLRHVPEALPDLPWEDPPQCFGDHQECRGDDVVEAYRKYYKARRSEIKMEWTNREKPQWL